MDEHQEAQDAANSARDHVKNAAEDFKAAASAKADEIRHAAEQKAEELRHAAEGKAREFRGAAETAWSDAQSKAKTWQTESESYMGENPTQPILGALCLGFLLGPMFREKFLDPDAALGAQVLKQSTGDSVRNWIASVISYLELRLSLIGLES